MDLKKVAAQHALSYVHSGMILGLGSGSTTTYFVDMLAEKLKSGEYNDILGVPTSQATAKRAASLGISLTTLTDHPVLDLAVDGADEVDPKLNLIKGLGRALLREKIIEIHAKEFIVIVDESKLVDRLGMKGPLPVEIVPFQAQAQINWLNTLGCIASMWLEQDGSEVITDNGNNLVLCHFPDGIPDVYDLAIKMNNRPGIIEHGLFLDMATRVIAGGEAGVRILERST